MFRPLLWRSPKFVKTVPRLSLIGPPSLLRKYCVISEQIDQKNVSLVLGNLLKNKRFSRAYKKIDDLKQKVQPNQIIYNQMLQIYAQNGDPKNLLQTCSEMSAAGMRPDAFTYNTLYSFYGKTNQLDQLDLTYQKMIDDGLEVPVRTYNVLVHAYVINGAYAKAQALFDKLSSHDTLQPDIVTFTEMMNLYIAQFQNNQIQFDHAIGQCRALIDQLKARGLVPDVRLYNKLLLLQSKHILQRDTLPVLLVYKEIKTSGLRPDLETYNILLKMYADLRNDKGIESTLLAMKVNGVTPQLSSFAILMEQHVKAGDLHSVQKCLAQIKQLNLEPDSALYAQLIRLYTTKGQIRLAMQALKAMKRQWSVPLDVQRQVFMLSASMGAATQTIQLFKSMQEDGLSLDLPIYNEVLKVCCTHSKVTDALQIYEDLKSSRVVSPDAQTFSSLISLFSSTFELATIGTLLTDMITVYGIFPSTEIQHIIYTMNEDSPELRPEAKLQIQTLKEQLKKIVRRWSNDDPSKKAISPKALKKPLKATPLKATPLKKHKTTSLKFGSKKQPRREA